LGHNEVNPVFRAIGLTFCGIKFKGEHGIENIP
jgi:hypothetical protein